MIFRIAFLCLLILSPGLGIASNTLTGMQLLEACKKGQAMADAAPQEMQDIVMSDIPFKAGVCSGTIQATINTFLMANPKDTEKTEYNLCIPNGWTGRQGIMVFIKWAEENPKDLNQPAIAAVLYSHQAAFPCN